MRYNLSLPRLCRIDDTLKTEKDTVMGGTQESKPG